jgi:hypothetical protein
MLTSSKELRSVFSFSTPWKRFFFHKVLAVSSGEAAGSGVLFVRRSGRFDFLLDSSYF